MPAVRQILGTGVPVDFGRGTIPPFGESGVPSVLTPLDTFNAGANQNLSARPGWYQSNIGGDLSLITDAGPTYAVNLSGSEALNFWNTIGAADSNVWVTYDSVVASFHWLWVRAQMTPASLTDGYFLYADVSGYTEIWKRVASVDTLLASGSKPTGAWLPGESVMLDATGTTLSAAYLPSGGTWTTYLSVTDASITSTGYIGKQVPAATTTRFDQFGGGPLVYDPWAPSITSILPEPSVLNRSRASSVFDSPTTVDVDLSFASQPPLPQYSPPTTQPVSVFDPATNTFADWTPAPIAVREVVNYSAPLSRAIGTFYDNAQNTPFAATSQAKRAYSAPLSRIFSVFDTPVSTDAMPISAASRLVQSILYPDSATFSAGDEPVPDDFSLVAQSRIVAKPPKPQNLTVFAADNAAAAAADLVPLVTLSRILAAKARPISVTVFFGDNPPAAPLGATSRQDTKPPKPRSLTILTTDTPAAPAADSFAFTTQSTRDLALVGGRGSSTTLAFDGASGVITNPGGGGIGVLVDPDWLRRYDPLYEARYAPGYKPTIRKQKKG